jgi:ubiquinone biosynthesis protein
MVMGLSLKPEHLRRYKDITRLFIKYGRRDVVQQAGLAGTSENGELLARDNGAAATRGVAAQADELAADLERLGPTFVKLGQLLSTRADLLPPAYLQALSRLQDRVEPFAFEEVQRILSDELAARPSKAFSEFDPHPIAAASLGQVHRAALRDGRPVAVKIQRPGIHDTIVKDLESLGEIARFLDAHTEVGRRYEFARIMDELRKSLLAELDYREEARNLHVLAENLARFERIIVPRPIDDFTTARVLTMQFIRGHKLTTLSPVALLEIDRCGLADELSRAYLTQIAIDGFFHADPHPGNVHLSEDGRLVLLDLGMVARLGVKTQESLMKLLLSISEGRGEDAAAIALEMATRKDGADPEAFARHASDLVARHHHARMQDISTGRVVLELQGVAADCGIRLPQEFTMIGKALMNLDAITRTLDPKFEPNASIRLHAGELLRRRMRRRLTAGSFFDAVLEASEFTQRLPARVNRIMESLSRNQFRMHIDAIDEEQLIRGLQKIANRITVGLILAALIIGAALIMRVETAFTIFGYPGMAMLLFAGAAIGGVMLVISILRSDR